MSHTNIRTLVRSAQEIADAPMFSVLAALPGASAPLGPEHWALFEVGRSYSQGVEAKARELGLPHAQSVEPQKDDTEAPEGAGDDDAALSYLSGDERRVLLKLPDELGSPYYRLYVPA